jgi:hypothetical protein
MKLSRSCPATEIRFAAAPAALLAFVLAVFAWLVFRPIFGRKTSASN